MPPGPAPLTKDRLPGKEARGTDVRPKEAREKPTLTVFSIFAGEKKCVSFRLNTCRRSGVYDANKGSANGF